MQRIGLYVGEQSKPLASDSIVFVVVQEARLVQFQNASREVR